MLAAHPSVSNAMLNHYYLALPNEAVGIILLDGTVLPLRNELASPNSYEVSAEQLAELCETYDPTEFAFIYHTHPSDTPQPSKADHEQMRYLHDFWPWIKHIIFTETAMQVWEVRSTGACVLGHYPLSN